MLFAVSVLPYLRVWNFGFVFDDVGYVTGNAVVRGGLSLAGLRWAFTTFTMGNWHPITWLSHLADVSIFGLKPGGPHLVNLVFHGANTILLDAFLQGATGCLRRSFIVAVLFAVHPVHVESVAWISERKDLLSTLFFLSGLIAFRRYTARPSFRRYAAVTALFIFGLLSKPMVVTMPLLFILCDFWPLNRMAETSGQGVRRFPLRRAAILAIEKIPFVLLSAGISIVSLSAQRQATALGSLTMFETSSRLKNAVVSYLLYIAKTLWPVALSVFYPHLGEVLTIREVIAAAVALAIISVLALAVGQRLGYFATGWVWYLITLLPVIGFIQVGSQGMADRYTYIPLIGLFIAVVWGMGDLSKRLRFPRSMTGPIAGAIVVALLGLSYKQAGFWHDEISLWKHAVALDRLNWFALNNLGLALYRQKRHEEAVGYLIEAVHIDPTYFDANLNLGLVLDRLGRPKEAIAALRRAIAISPGTPMSYFNLGLVYIGQGDRASALGVYRELLAVDAAQAARFLSFITKTPHASDR